MKLLIFFCLFAVIFAVFADDNDKPCMAPPGRVLFRPQRPVWIDCKNDSDCPEGKKCVWICNGRGYCS
uniref:Uncharacterized protein n=1 Tax=Panagrolaimus davidi TaxID=227884 RepID=A0A914P159_9BILA